MSSELFVFDNSFFCDPFSLLTESPVDPQSDELLQEIQENTLLFDETNSLDPITPILLSSSPSSCVNLESLSLSHLGNDEFSVKKEEYHIPFGNAVMGQSYDDKFMQRSCSSNSFDGKGKIMNSPFHPAGFYGISVESQNLQKQVLNSPESGFSSCQVRRVCSTGDLQNMKANVQTRTVLSSSPLSTERSFMEEPNFKVGKYSAEERKERIHRYRAKRTQRNFSKTIKYACRKTLADSRPRVRGRFARNDEGEEIPKASTFNRYEDEDDIWLDGFLEEEDEGIIGGGSFLERFGSTQYHNYSYRC